MTGPQRLVWLQPGGPPDAFPDPAHAMREPNGLLAAGGDLSPERLLAAYRRGIFPWFSAGQPILWWCPEPRAILAPRDFHVSRSLRRALRSGGFEVSVDQCFERVIERCGETRRASGTWLTPEMIAAYCELHRLGVAHSVESWQDGELAGGIYGVGLGSVFFGESMVSLRRDGSKVAMTKLVELSLSEGIELIDCQVGNPHLASLGCSSIPREAFLERVTRLVGLLPACRFQPQTPQPASPLAARE